MNFQLGLRYRIAHATAKICTLSAFASLLSLYVLYLKQRFLAKIFPEFVEGVLIYELVELVSGYHSLILNGDDISATSIYGETRERCATHNAEYMVLAAP